MKAIEDGDLVVKGRTPSGALRVHFKEDGGRRSAPRTVWDNVSHSASEHGSMLLRAIIPGRNFPFPKALSLQRHLHLTHRFSLHTLLPQAEITTFRRQRMLPAYRTEGEAFAIPKFELTPQDVNGFLDRIGICIFCD